MGWQDQEIVEAAGEVVDERRHGSVDPHLLLIRDPD
jgi:hypothetical protein